ncbi:hypothetical protein GCM10023321_21520 [Pseudonocardia eucalypti]|uniref:PucR family transcriptional regulator n=1 Tax=Pseudonocardia eucalypti TaxID=648755 RepID=A0ABP9PVA3_9PSEU|nr:DNA-binding PucR family transcriptional regulator [Pseudonocardia eucalypti]
MTGPGRWIRELSPHEPDALTRSALGAEKVGRFVERLGPGPVGWAVELGRGMAAHIAAQIPELGVDGVVQEIGRGGEAVALGLVAALADAHDLTLAAPPEFLAGPGEAVSRGVGIEHVLRSIHIGHGYASRMVLAAAEQHLPPGERFAELRRISDLLFTAVNALSAEMVREFATVRDAWLASSTAVRIELVRQILDGDPVPVSRTTRTLGYDLTRHHLALVVWSEEPVGPSQLEGVASAMLRSADRTAALILPIGRRRVWAWGSGVHAAPFSGPVAAPAAGVRVAAGLPAPGVRGFRTSHVQALEAARVGAQSRTGRWLFDYAELDLVAMLSTRLDVAAEFVRRELRGLAGPDENAAMLRATLKSYLDAERSLQLAAERLHIARGTVAYRIQRAEQLRGREIGVRRMQLQAALTLAEELGDAVLTERA